MIQRCLFTFISLLFAFMAFAREHLATENKVTLSKEISSDKNPSDTSAKKIYYPKKVWMVPDSNDYSNNNSPFSNQRMVESADITMFWAKEYGDDPTGYAEPIRRFNPAIAVSELERFYICYRDTLKFVTKGGSLTDKYKMLTYVFHSTTDGTA